jgi:hypothetical protein
MTPTTLMDRRAVRALARQLALQSISESQAFLAIHRGISLAGWPVGIRLCGMPTTAAANGLVTPNDSA